MMTARSWMTAFALLALLALVPIASSCTAPTEAPPADSAGEDMAGEDMDSDESASDESANDESSGAPPTAEPVSASGEGSDAYVPPDVPTEFTDIDGDALTTIGNQTYTIDGVEYPLVEGLYDEPAEHMMVGVYPPAAVGDLTGDGNDDAAVLLAQQTGGSGTFQYLAVVMDVDGDAVATDTVALGDRVKVTAMNIADGVLTMDVVTHGPDDPMCCPTDVQTWMFTVTDGTIELVSEQGPTSMTS